MRVLKISR